jgi:hypothetical protein
MRTDNFIDFIFKIRNTLRFLIMLSLSFILYYSGVLGAWVFILDIPDLIYSLKEIRNFNET